MQIGGGCFDASEIIVEIRFGEGGEDSKLFVEQLFATYVKYALRKGFHAEILLESHGHILAQITGQHVFQAFQNETGQHACQRVPETERGGRRHTSIVSVAVLPVRNNVVSEISLGDVEIIAQRGTQKCGGQKANKTSSAIRATHRPTGISVFIQNERSQHQNKEQALRILAQRVTDTYKSKQDRDYMQFRQKQLGDGRRGSKIRTYNFFNARVSDHRLGTKTSQIEKVMNGFLELLF